MLKMASRSQMIRRFVGDYAREYSTIKEAANLASDYVRKILDDPALQVHLVACRAKDPSSLKHKLRLKRYKNPEKQLTDRIGLRVITYYADDVDRVVDKLVQSFTIDPKNSEDKRKQLSVEEFGYRSVQLIAKARDPGSLHLKYAGLKNLWVEIQVRSILEHAWAEIQHGIVYKSQIKYPDSVLRRFAALAGTLEILEGEFLSLKTEREKLIDHYREVYRIRKDYRVRLDPARLIGFMEAEHPKNPGWRSCEAEGKPLPIKIDVTCVEALRAVELSTAFSLRRKLRSARFRALVRRLVGRQGLNARTVSHLSLIVLAVASQNARTLEEFFPEMADSPAMRSIVLRLKR